MSHSHSTQNRLFRRPSPSQSLGLVKANLLAWYEKPNVTQQKHTFANQKKRKTTQNKHKKLKPGFVTTYDIWTGKGEGLFWFWCFIILSLTYLLHFTSVLWCCWLSRRKGIRPVKTEWWGTGVVICLKQGANDLHMVQLMPLPPRHLLLQ